MIFPAGKPAEKVTNGDNMITDAAIGRKCKLVAKCPNFVHVTAGTSKTGHKFPLQHCPILHKMKLLNYFPMQPNTEYIAILLVYKGKAVACGI